MFTLAEIAEHIQAEVIGDPQCEIMGIATLVDANVGQLSFLDNAKYRRYLAETAASAVILKSDDKPQCKTNALVVAEPYVAFAKAAQLFSPRPTVIPGVHPTAIIDDTAVVDASASIGAYVVIGADCQVGANVSVAAHATLSNHVTVGAHTIIHANVTLYHGATIGEHCELHSGVVIGADGFGLANEDGRWVHVPQMGNVQIGNNVSIGANTTIDRGTIGDTKIHDGVKLDNQIQIAHNVEIGEHTAVAACVGISGSTKIGKHCILAGGVGVAGHLTIADNVIVTAMTGISSSIKEAGMYSSGLPAQSNREWRRNAVTLKRIDKLVSKVNQIEAKLKVQS